MKGKNNNLLSMVFDENVFETKMDIKPPKKNLILCRNSYDEFLANSNLIIYPRFKNPMKKI